MNVGRDIERTEDDVKVTQMGRRSRKPVVDDYRLKGRSALCTVGWEGFVGVSRSFRDLGLFWNLSAVLASPNWKKVGGVECTVCLG